MHAGEFLRDDRAPGRNDGTGADRDGTDLCQDQPDSIVEWMRVGRWTKDIDYGEGSAANAGFPPMPEWFTDNRHFGNVADGLAAQGFAAGEIEGIMGENWLAFFDASFGAANG